MDSKTLLKKRDEFLLHYCKYIAGVIIDIETELYEKVSKMKAQNKYDKLRSNDMSVVISNMLENKFNEMFCTIIDGEDLDKKYMKLLTYFNHNKLGLLYCMASSCVDIHLSIDRENIETKSKEEYINSVSVIVNDQLNEEYNNILKRVISEVGSKKYTDEMIDSEEIQENRSPFKFTVAN